MSQTAKAYPDIVSIVEYGKTYEKRTISLLKVPFGVRSKIQEGYRHVFVIKRPNDLSRLV